MPNIDPSAIKMLSSYMSKNICDIATLASQFKDRKEIENINNVKVVTNEPLSSNQFHEATDFFLEKMKIQKKDISIIT